MGLSACEDKRRMIQVAWYSAMVVAVCYVISSIVVAARLHKTPMPEATQPAGFAAIWSMLLLILILVGGSVVFHRIQTPIATGVFLGAVAMFSQIELMLFAIFQSISRKDSLSPGDASAAGAIAAFSFFLFVIFGVFTLFLTLWREHVPVGGGAASSMDSYA